MKVIITQKQLQQIRENASKKFSCENCDHSWEIEKKDEHPYLCHMCGYDSAKEKHNYDELENFWKNYKKEEEVTEKWSEKYKKSINCNNPKGFSQRAHCQGRKKNLKEEFEKEQLFKEVIERDVNEYASNYEWCDGIEIDIRETNWLTEKQKPVYEYKIKFKNTSMVSYKEQENLFDDIMFVHTMYFPIEESDVDCYMSVKSVYPNGVERSFPYSYDNYNEQITESEEKEEPTLIEGEYNLDKIKKALKILSQISDSFGEYIPLDFKLYGYEFKRSVNLKVMVLYIDVDSEDGVYDATSRVWFEISQQLLEIFQMMGIRDEKRMYPSYDFKFNKRSLEGITIV
jgi:ribosomal protein L37AE/L43A